MSFGAEARAMASGLIDFFGDSSEVTLKRTVTTVHPDTGASTTVVTSETCLGCFVEITERFRDSQTLQSGDRSILVPGDIAIVPDTKTVVIDGSDSYKVIESVSVSPGDTVAYYKLLVREV